MTSSAILSLANPVLAIFFAVTFYFVWQRQPDRRFILNWSIVFVIAALGFTIEAQRSNLDEAAISIAINLCHALVALFTARGLALRYVGSPQDRIFAAIFICSSAAMIWFTLGEPHILSRGLSTSIGMSLTLLLAGGFVLRSGSKDYIDIAICAALFIVASLICARPLLATQLAPLAVDDEGNKETLYIYSAMLLALFAWVGFAILFLVRIATDVMSELEELTLTDAMTGLLNRRGFFDRGSRLLDGCVSSQPSAMLLLDIDRFKRINDTYGHYIGDTVIRWVAKRLTILAPHGILARIGGEEFVVLLPHADLVAAKKLAEEIRSDVQNNAIDATPSDLRATISAGITSVDIWIDLDTALINADKALYAAKRAGRNQVAVFDQNHDVLKRAPNFNEAKLA